MDRKEEITREYINIYMPKFSKSACAKKLFLDHPLLFPSEDAARSMIRRITGAMGDEKRNSVTDPIIQQNPYSRENPFGWPESDEKEFVIYKLPVVYNRILFLTDIHLPYHNIPALNEAVKYGQEKDVNCIWLDGDIMDCYQASDHEKDPSKRDFSEELVIARNFLDQLQKAFPKAKIFYKEGNHEKRWRRFLQKNAPIVLKTGEFELPVLLGLRERGIEWIPNKQLTQFGRLNVIHGNEMAGGGGINVARTLWLRAGESVIAGDKHKTQSAIKTTISNTVYGTWSVGCLCELNPDYMPYNEWNRGFAYIEVKESGDFKVWNEQIYR